MNTYVHILYVYIYVHTYVNAVPFLNICTLLKEPNYIIIGIHPVTYVFFNRLSQVIMFLDFGRNVNISGLIYTHITKGRSDAHFKASFS